MAAEAAAACCCCCCCCCCIGTPREAIAVGCKQAQLSARARQTHNAPALLTPSGTPAPQRPNRSQAQTQQTRMTKRTHQVRRRAAGSQAPAAQRGSCETSQPCAQRELREQPTVSATRDMEISSLTGRDGGNEGRQSASSLGGGCLRGSGRRGCSRARLTGRGRDCLRGWQQALVDLVHPVQLRHTPATREAVN